MGTETSGQLEHFVFVALPGIDLTLGIYSCCKFQGALQVKINKRKCTTNQKAQANFRDRMPL